MISVYLTIDKTGNKVSKIYLLAFEDDVRLFGIKLVWEDEEKILKEAAQLITELYQYSRSTVVFVKEKHDYKFFLERCGKYGIKARKRINLKVFGGEP